MDKNLHNGSIEGNWLGKIDSLRIVFRITQDEHGSFTAFLDSPDQEVFDIPVNDVVFVEGRIRLELRPLQITYEGKMVETSRIVGEWKQGGNSVMLVLDRVDKVPQPPHRPQTPVKPYPYNEEEVVYENKNAGVRLAGTLTLPRGNGPFPAVLLVAGSGPMDRDETVFYHKPFMVLADYLTCRGFAVLRADKRGVGKSTGVFGQATNEDFSSDVLAGVEYLRNRKDVNPRFIGLIGHSAGGQISAVVASQSSDVAFIVMMAGVGIRGYDNTVLQDVMTAKEKGATEEELALIRSWCKRFYAVPLQEKDDAVARRMMEELYKNRTDEENRAFRFLKGWTLEIDNALSPYMRYSLAFNPRPFLKKVKCPVLAINGERDTQVPSKENLQGIQEALRAGGNHSFKVKELPNINHMFQTVKLGGVTDYSKIEETTSPLVLKLVADWLTKQINAEPEAKPSKWT